MMLLNIKQCRWCSVAWQEFEQCSKSLLGAADRRRMTRRCAYTEYTQKTTCSNFKDMARRETRHYAHIKRLIMFTFKGPTFSKRHVLGNAVL